MQLTGSIVRILTQVFWLIAPPPPPALRHTHTQFVIIPGGNNFLLYVEKG